MRMIVYNPVINQRKVQLIVDWTFQMCHKHHCGIHGQVLGAISELQTAELYSQTKIAILDLMPPHKRVCRLILYISLQKPTAFQLLRMSFLAELIRGQNIGGHQKYQTPKDVTKQTPNKKNISITDRYSAIHALQPSNW